MKRLSVKVKERSERGRRSRRVPLFALILWPQYNDGMGWSGFIDSHGIRYAPKLSVVWLWKVAGPIRGSLE